MPKEVCRLLSTLSWVPAAVVTGTKFASLTCGSTLFIAAVVFLSRETLSALAAFDSILMLAYFAQMFQKYVCSFE